MIPAEALMLLELLKDHPPRKCGDLNAHKDAEAPLLESKLGLLDRDRSDHADAAVYECPKCGWKRTEPLKLNARG